MKKTLLVLVALLLLAWGIAPAAAAPVADLTDLARYVPDSTAVYVGVSTDDAAIATIDGLLAHISAITGEDFDGMTLRGTLDELASMVEPGGTFDTTFAWLGDSAALALLDANTLASGRDIPPTEAPVAFVVHLLDAEGAISYLDGVLDADDYETQNIEMGTLYVPVTNTSAPLQILVLDDAMLLTPVGVDVTKVPTQAPLSESADFQTAMSRLPGEDYGVVTYLNVPEFAMVAEQMQRRGFGEDLAFMDADFPAALTAMGGQALGFTVMGERSLVMDGGFGIADVAAYEEALGMPLPTMNSAPIDLEFTDNLPADTALVLQATDPGTRILEQMAMLEAMGAYYDELEASGQLPFDQRELGQLSELLTFMRLSFQGLSGLTMDEAFGWMTGNAVSYINVVPDDVLGVSVDFGMMLEVTDANAATAFVQGMVNLTYELGLDQVDEDGVLVLPGLGRLLETPALDVLLTEDGAMLLAGTRPGVETIMAGEGGFASSAHFQTASEIFLSDPQVLAYINVAPLRALVETLAQQGMLPMRDARQAQMLLSLFESASITAHSDGTDGAVRFVLTLAE